MSAKQCSQESPIWSASASAGLLILFFFLTSTLRAEQRPWTLIWAEEFETPGAPDPQRWNYEVGFVRNRELQYYTDDRRENARVADGKLVLEARRESWPNDRFDPNVRDGHPRSWMKTRRQADYTSASITTEGKTSWTYGRLEVRAKLPRGKGVWPAIWMLGDDFRQIGWPTCGEIDIMEFVGFKPNAVHANAHCKKYNHIDKTAQSGVLEVENLTSGFHVYAIEWFSDRIDFYFDDRKYHTFHNDGTGQDAWPFDRPHYLLLNLAIGGAWGGREGIDDSIFPQQYLVDYVRVYQQAE